MYFKARFYDSSVGRFITADPTIPNMFSSQSFNRYMFVSGSPIQLIDSSGFDGEGGNTQSTTESVSGGGDPPPPAGSKIPADFSNGGNNGGGGSSNGKDNDYANLYNAFSGSAPASVAPQNVDLNKSDGRQGYIDDNRSQFYNGNYLTKPSWLEGPYENALWEMGDETMRRGMVDSYILRYGAEKFGSCPDNNVQFARDILRNNNASYDWMDNSFIKADYNISKGLAPNKTTVAMQVYSFPLNPINILSIIAIIRISGNSDNYPELRYGRYHLSYTNGKKPKARIHFDMHDVFNEPYKHYLESR